LKRNDVKIRWNPPFLFELMLSCFHWPDRLQPLFDMTKPDAIFDNYRTQSNQSGHSGLLSVFDNFAGRPIGLLFMAGIY